MHWVQVGSIHEPDLSDACRVRDSKVRAVGADGSHRTGRNLGSPARTDVPQLERDLGDHPSCCVVEANAYGDVGFRGHRRSDRSQRGIQDCGGSIGREDGQVSPCKARAELVSELYELAMGRNDQLDYLRDRFAELGHVEPDESDAALERGYGAPTDRTLADYLTRRKELLLALLDSRADKLDRAAEEMGRFFDHLRQVGIRGYVAENANDPDYVRAPEHRGLPHPADAEKTMRASRRTAQEKPRGDR
jgi:hypothetical protein